MLNEIIFLILAAVILVGAIKMLAADEPVHAAIYLGLVLAGVAGIYLTLGAEFLAAIQILIYVGAVVTLLLFAVMLTTHASPTEGYAEDRTPLSVLGIEGAPQGMDVESLEEVPAEAETVDEAEAHADLERRDEETVRRDLVEDEAAPDEDVEDGEPADDAEAADEAGDDREDTPDEPADEASGETGDPDDTTEDASQASDAETPDDETAEDEEGRA